MATWALYILAAASVQSVLGSYYHGPTAAPHVLKSGYLADTHEVAAAKGAHLAALAKESHNSYGGDYTGSYGHGGDYSGSYGHGGDYSESYGYRSDYGHGHDIKYHGPIAIPHVLKNGHIADTHEVAVAKAQHYAAVSKAKSYGGYGHSGDYGYGGSYGYDQGGHVGSYGGVYDRTYGHGHDFKYHGPTAIPHVLKNGHIADTHEVAAAKVKHYAAVAVSKSHGGNGYAGGYGYNHGDSYDNGHSGDYGYGGSYGYGQGGHVGSHGGVYEHSYGHGHKYHGPIAIPHVLKSGYLADTHEVAAAKAEHHDAVAEAKSHSGYGHGHGYSHGYNGHY